MTDPKSDPVTSDLHSSDLHASDLHASDLPGPSVDPPPADAVFDTVAADPRWARPALAALLLCTFVLYVWGLSRNGWANEFYTAAVQAGSKSWKAFFFGSSDAGNTITVDKPPVSLWPQVLSVRIFGLNSWSLLVPEALMGVATVGVLYAAIRRWFGVGAGLLAGAVLALTPAAALMFRFNNPDALLVLLLVVAAAAALRAIEEDRLRWFVWCGVAVGLGFLTKQLQAFLVVPGFALALLVAGRGSLWRRLRGLGVAGLSVVVSAGWWVAHTELWDKGSRPYIGGSTNNSFLELTFGYNGLGRITGDEGGALGGAGGPGGGGGPFGGSGGIGSPFSADRGVGRLFGGVIGGQVAWLLPAALAAVVVGLWLSRRAPRVDMQRASVIVWGMWLLVTGATFSFMSGVFHEYYTVALAPAIGALVGIGGSMLWANRHHWAAAVTAAVVVAGSALWARALVARAPSWNSWLQAAVIVVGVLATIGLLGLAWAALRQMVVPRGLVVGAASVVLAALFIGPTSWSAQTVATAHTGSIVTAGPAVSAASGPGGFRGSGAFPGGAALEGELPAGLELGDLPSGLPGFGGPGGGIGPGETGQPSAEVLATLTSGSGSFTWMAATVGATAAAPYQIATGLAVMPIGGFSGGDPAPTLDQFKALVDGGEIHWFIGGGFGGTPRGFGAEQGGLDTGELPPGFQLPEGFELPQGGGLPADPPSGTGFPAGFGPPSGGPGAGGGNPGAANGASQSISQWVSEHFTAVTVDGVTLYDLTMPTSTG